MLAHIDEDSMKAPTLFLHVKYVVEVLSLLTEPCHQFMKSFGKSLVSLYVPIGPLWPRTQLDVTHNQY